MKISMIALAVSAVLFSATADAAVLQTDCAGEYAGGQAPDLRNEKLSDRLVEVCYSQFGVFHSGLTATPLFVGQHLTADIVSKAKRIDRNDVFHPEKELPKSDRAELAHYRSSGFDRGHMAPAADMATNAANDESFSLANMVPQMPSLNRGAWADIEETTRQLAVKYGEVYVVTGPVFAGARLSRIGGRVLVPSSVYKAVYVPSTGQSSAWWADNVTGGMEVLSVAQLAERVGADVFPAVTATSKSSVVSLPLPGEASGVAVTRQDEVAVGGQIDMVPEHVPVESWWQRALVILLSILEAVLRTVLRS